MLDLLKRNPYALILALLFHLALMLLFWAQPEMRFMDSAAPLETMLEDKAAEPEDDPETEINEALPEDALIVVVEESLLAQKLQQFQDSNNRKNVLGLKMPEDPRIAAMREKEKEEQRRKQLEEQRRKQEQKQLQLEKKKAEEKRQKELENKKAAEKKKQELEKKKAAEKKKQEQEKKKAEEKKKQELEKKKAAEKKKQELEKKKAAEKKKQDQEKKKAAEKKKRVQEKKKAAEKKRAAEKKKAAQNKSKASASGNKKESGKDGKSGKARKQGAGSSKGKSGGTGGGGPGRHSGGGGGKNYDKYISQIRSKITRNWRRPPGVDNRLTTSLRVKLFPGGAVADVTITRSSGNAAYDRSARDAVEKASPLPVPKGSAFDKFRSLTLRFSPTGIR